MRNFIPYDKKLVSRARELRKEETRAEKLLWEEVLKNRQLLGLKFTRQKPLGHFIVDFYCAELMLAIEIDGGVHHGQKIRDRERDSILEEKFGLKIIRYMNEEVLNNLQKIKTHLTSLIREECIKSPDKGI